MQAAHASSQAPYDPATVAAVAAAAAAAAAQGHMSSGYGVPPQHHYSSLLADSAPPMHLYEAPSQYDEMDHIHAATYCLEG
jgi:hypothetical protein